MKIKNKTILNSVDSLKELLNYDIPVKTSFKLIKNTKKIDSVLDLYNEANNKLIEKYGDKKEDGELDISPEGNIKISQDKINDYMKEKSDLLEIENDIDIEVIKSDELLLDKVKPSILLALDYMIEI